MSIGREPRVYRVAARSPGAVQGRITVGTIDLACALGRTGCRWRKREGDGATPRGLLRFEHVYYRRDRVQRPQTGLEVRAIRPDDAWCDVVGDRNYNRHVRLPYPCRDEQLWRDDGLYDICVVLDYNRRPRVQGAGCAIFMHLARANPARADMARADMAPTAGCVALAERDLRLLLARAAPGDGLLVR